MNRRQSELIFLFVMLGHVVSMGRLAMAVGDRDDQVRTKSRAADLLGSPGWGSNLPGPLCGIYAACTAVELIGLEADPRNYLMSKYLGGCGGSSPEEVALVVKDAHARADISSGLSAFDLRLIQCPLIANVRSSLNSNRFDHWVVAMPNATGVLIFDGRKKPYTIPTAEFLAMWSGVGICVTRDVPTPLLSIWLGRSSILLMVALLAVLAVRSRVSLALVGPSTLFNQLLGFCFTSFVLAIPGNLIFGDLPHHAKGVAVATASGGKATYRSGTLDDARKASASDDMLLVDARLETDYRLGTIAGAVNIPVSASHSEIENYVEKLPRSTPVVVFCQSVSCGFDETVASEFTLLGFSDVTVCNEGWAEFQKSRSGAERQ